MQSQHFLVIIATIFVFVRADKYLSEKPPQLTPCKMGDTNFNKCLAKNFQTLFVEWKDGVPGLSSVGKFDPLQVKRIKIAHDNNQGLSLNMDLSNVWISGASKAVVQDVRLDNKNWKIVAKIFAPRLDFDSEYKVKGHVLALPLNGSGKSKFSTENAVFTLKISLKLRDDGDVTFTEIESLESTIESIGNFHLQTNNLFNGQKDLEDAANALFNENWRELYAALRPAIEQTIGKVLENRLKKLYHYVPGNYFIADLPKAADVYG